MNTFLSHPSVRIKGTENNYDPVQCVNPSCPNRNPHMHCPFCVNTEYFQDPVILKAHYRVKHVDKGIEFAGLKVLRCCDHCDIVGSIKGSKEIKGAHWHCYRCRNGFNRRDEAFKHFRTHFRNPQTTFQIQVQQEVNQIYSLSDEADRASDGISQQDLSNIQVHTLSEGVMGEMHLITQSDLQPQLLSSPITNGKAGEVGELQVSVAANETVGTSSGLVSEPQTIMIIQEDQLEESEAQDDGLVERTMEITRETLLEKTIQRLSLRNQELEAEKSAMEKTLRAEIQELKSQVKAQSERITGHQHREQELISQLTIPLDDRTTEMLTSLKDQHEELLHQQLAQLKQSYLQSLAQSSYAAGSLTAAGFDDDDNEVVTLTLPPDGATGQSMLITSDGHAIVTSDGQPIVTTSCGQAIVTSESSIETASAGYQVVSSDSQAIVTSKDHQPVVTSADLDTDPAMTSDPNRGGLVMEVTEEESVAAVDAAGIISFHEDSSTAHVELVKTEPGTDQEVAGSLGGVKTLQFKLVDATEHKHEQEEDEEEETHLTTVKRRKLTAS